MTLIYKNFLPLYCIAVFALIFFIYRKEVIFFSWISTYWNLKRSWVSFFSSVFLIISLCLFLLSILDIRGPIEHIEASISDQKTIILIDNSASMLVRDVRPNRFERSVTLARHFVKNSAGHQISILLFSDTHKKLIPFTDDLDLLDSRLASLQNYHLTRGGSNITQAIAESIQYFKQGIRDNEEAVGNILILTDSEEHEERFPFDVPSGINLAAVGVGTHSGGRIPLRNRDGFFTGYKKHRNKEVISKLNEDNIKSIGKGFENFRYWIVLSYDLPTENILSFFRNSFQKSISKQQITQRPVLMHYLTIPAVISYVIFMVLFKFKSFSPLILFFLITEVESNDDIFERYKRGNATVEEKAVLAFSFLEKQEYDRAKFIYRDIVDRRYKANTDYLFNYATSMLYSGDVDNAMDVYAKLAKSTEDVDIKEKIQNNILHFFKQKKDDKKNTKEGDKEGEKEPQKDKQEEKKGEPNEEDESQNNDKNQSEKQEGESSKEKQDEQERWDDSNDDQEINQDKSEDQQKDKSQEQQKDTNNDDQEDGNQMEKQKEASSPQTVEDREQDIKDKRKLTKVPTILKKLMENDRELQEKFIDTRTRQNNNQSNIKDW